MTDKEKITMVKALIGNDSDLTDELAMIYLTIAKEAIVSRLYIGESKKDMPTRYDTLQCEVARNAYLKRGAEGESSHNENGINRTYFDEDKILDRITPIAKV